MPEIYKEGQGVLVRRVAFWVLVVLIVWGGQSLYTWLVNGGFGWEWMGGAWQWPAKLILEDKNPLDGYSIPVLDQRFNWGFVVSWGLVALACLWLYRFLNRPRSADFLIETDTEFKKVTWPTRKDAWNSSLIVVVFVLMLTAFLVFSDKIIAWVFDLVMGV